MRYLPKWRAACLPLALLWLWSACASAANLPPTADAGGNQSVGLGVNVTLDGSRSHDADGIIKKYLWQQLKGQKVKLSDKRSPTPSFVSPARLAAKPADNRLLFKLTVTDNRKRKAQATVAVTVDVILCAPPQYAVDGICQTPQPVCPKPNVIRAGQCVPPPVLTCAAPLQPLDGVCKLPPLQCEAQAIAQNGVCALPFVDALRNDTGISACSDTEHYGTACPLANYPGQDAEFGRDRWFADDADGRAGFSFKKLGGDGGALPNDADTWDCVRDQVTGLIWENKTDAGLRDWSRQFAFGDGPDAANGYVDAVNAQGLCGFRDWRLPSVAELQDLVDYGRIYPGPALDPTFFRFVKNNAYWTADTHAAKALNAWTVHFDDGRVFDDVRSTPLSLRLVRGESEANATPFVVSTDGQEVTDLRTGLIWQRCAYGMTWQNGACEGSPTYFMWYEALPVAEQQARGKQRVWRLPNVKELASLLDRTRINQAIDDAAFPNTPNAPFWSASPYAADAFYAWEVNFFDGAVYYSYLEDLAAIRLVRDGQAED